MSQAYDLFQRHTEIVDEFVKQNHISQKEAENIL
jgi:hypothetical protein